MHARVFLISGIPGAGKTTVARLLAQRFERSVHIEGDAFYRFIVRGLVLPSDGPNEEADRQLAVRRRVMSLAANEYREADFDVVLDDVVVSRRVLAEEFGQLRHPFTFVQLTPNLDVVEQRDAGRDKHFFHVFKHLDAQMRAWPEPRPGLWLDSSDMTADETVDAILR